MIQRRFPTALLCLAFLTASGAAHATSKPRPAGQPASAPTLQQILDGLVVSGPAIDADSAANIELWQNSSAPLTATVAADFTGKKEKVKFGIFDNGHPGTEAFLLSDFTGGIAHPHQIATVNFDDGGAITINGGLQRKGNGFDGPFGFFARDSMPRSSPVFLFTRADLNGGDMHVKVFRGNNSTLLKLPGHRPGVFLDSEFLIAFETGSGDGGGGFNDFVVLVSGILPVPEPAALGLAALSSLALLLKRRRLSA